MRPSALAFLALLAGAAGADPCSLNGDYDAAAATCRCDPGWWGAACTKLKLGPVPSANPGYYNTSLPTWSGNVMKGRGEDEWHWYLGAKYELNGVNDDYLCNSKIVHLTSKKREGPYQYKEDVLSNFHLSPNVVEHNGTFVMYSVGYNHMPTVEECAPGEHTPIFYNSSHNTIHVSHTTDLTSNIWQHNDRPVFDPFPGPVNRTQWDCHVQNPTAYVFPNGTTLMMYRATPCIKTGHNQETIGVAVADHWSGPFRRMEKAIIPYPNVNEDPFLWRNKRGFHMLLHSQNAHGPTHELTGAYAYSEDGLSWDYSADDPWTPDVHFTNGTSATFVRRQKPALIFDDDNNPAYLINGVDYTHENGTQWGTGWTLVQPIEA